MSFADATTFLARLGTRHAHDGTAGVAPTAIDPAGPQTPSVAQWNGYMSTMTKYTVLKVGDLEAKDRALEDKARELEARTDELAAKTDELEDRDEELAAKTDELATKTDALEVNHAALEVNHAALENDFKTRTDQLKLGGHELAAKAAALDVATKALTHRTDRMKVVTEELQADRLGLLQRIASLEARSPALPARHPVRPARNAVAAAIQKKAYRPNNNYWVKADHPEIPVNVYKYSVHKRVQFKWRKRSMGIIYGSRAAFETMEQAVAAMHADFAGAVITNPSLAQLGTTVLV